MCHVNRMARTPEELLWKCAGGEESHLEGDVEGVNHWASFSASIISPHSSGFAVVCTELPGIHNVLWKTFWDLVL